MATVNLMDLKPETTARMPELLRLSNDELAVIPFTANAAPVQLHYLDIASIKSYAHCNGKDCDLCQIGKSISSKYLLPVFSSVHRAVGLLPISTSMKPGSLAPQITREVGLCLEGDKRVLLIKKISDYNFTVRSAPLPDTVDDGAKQIKAFVDMLKDGKFELASVYPTYSNEQLRQVSEIREQRELRGLLNE